MIDSQPEVLRLKHDPLPILTLCQIAGIIQDKVQCSSLVVKTQNESGGTSDQMVTKAALTPSTHLDIDSAVIIACSLCIRQVRIRPQYHMKRCQRADCETACWSEYRRNSLSTTYLPAIEKHLTDFDSRHYCVYSAPSDCPFRKLCRHAIFGRTHISSCHL